MRIAAVTEPGRIVIQDAPMPEPKPWEALVKIDACAICNGTDTKILQGHFPGMGVYPVIPGHESTGTVVEVGNLVKRYKVGDRVLRPAADPPGMRSMWGGFAEHGLAGDPNAFRTENPDKGVDWRWSMQQIVPPGISADDATVLITLKETHSFLRKFQVCAENRVLVLGAGPVSLSFAYWCRLRGCSVVGIAARRSDVRDRALSFGANALIDLSQEDLRSQAMEVTSGKGFDRIVDAVGSHELVARCMPMLSPGGWIGVYGIADATTAGLGEVRAPRTGEFALFSLNPDEPSAHDDVLRLVLDGKACPSDFVTHRLPLEEIGEGFGLVADRSAVKVVMEMLSSS